MRRYIFSTLLPIFLVISIFLSGCGDGGSSDSSSNNGTPPTINTATFYRKDGDNWVATQEIFNGDEVWLAIELTDPEMDIEVLVIESYYPSDHNIPFLDPYENSLPSQPNVSDVWNEYVSNWNRPTGDWREEIYVVDAKGNESNTWTIYFSVSDP